MGVLDILYNQRSLTKQLNKIKPVETFALNNIFTDVERHATENVDIEIINGYSDIATFVPDNQEEGNQVGKNEGTVKQVKIPRTYETKVWKVQELAAISSLAKTYDMTDQDKKDAIAEVLKRELQHLKDRVIRLREKIAIEALSTGKIVVAQKNLKFTLDFGYVTDKQKETLATADKWNAETAPNIGNQIHDWRKKAKGANMMLLDPYAAKLFMSNAEVVKELDTNNKKVGALDFTKEFGDAVIHLGMYRGLQVYEYLYTYDKNGTETNILDENKAILVNSRRRFPLHFAPVNRIENGDLKIYNTEFYFKPFTNTKGTSLEWDMEQKSLPTIYDLDAVYSVKVV